MRFAVLAIAAAAVDAIPAPQVSRLAIVAVVIVGVDALPRPHYDSIDAIVGAENVGELNGKCPNRCPGNKGKITCADSRCSYCIACQSASPPPPPSPLPSPPPAASPVNVTPLPSPAEGGSEPQASPAPGDENLVVVRRNILDLTSEEQGRFLSAINLMQAPGYGGPFQTSEALHGHGAEAACIHRKKNFAHWHRIYLYEFENKLQDAHEELYGTRNVSLPYWDSFQMFLDGDTTLLLFKPEVMAQADALGDAANMQHLLGERPTNTKARKVYDDGFTLSGNKNLAKLWQHKSWASVPEFLETFVREDVGWGSMLTTLENLHNGPHLAVGDPMKPLLTAAVHIYFWMHHCNIDRYFDSFLAAREALDGSRLVLEQEIAATTGKNDIWDVWLAPFVKADGSHWTVNGTHRTEDFMYRYDSHFTAANLLGSKAYKKKVASQKVHTTSLTTAVIRYGEPHGSPCTLTEEQPPFVMHFFLQPKAGPPLTLPTSTDQLGNATGYAGSLAHWGGWDGSQQMATEKDEPEIIMRIDGRPYDYDVIVLYDEDEEDPGPLLTAPTFWVDVAACNGTTPVPDASWATLSYLHLDGP